MKMNFGGTSGLFGSTSGPFGSSSGPFGSTSSPFGSTSGSGSTFGSTSISIFTFARPAGETEHQVIERSDCVGVLSEEPREVRVRWRISDFHSVLSEEKEKNIRSPVFFLDNGAWNLVMHIRENPSQRYRQQIPSTCECFMRHGLYLRRVDSGSPKTMTFEMAFINEKGEKEFSKTLIEKFSKANEQKGWSTFCSESDLKHRECSLLPHDTLTVACTLSTGEEQPTDHSLFRRLWNLSLDWKNVFYSGENTDVTLKLKDGEVKAHELIIRSRSAELGRELRQAGEVAFEDAGKEAFNVVLSYIYWGHPQGLSSENVWKVYRTSHKYELHELRKCCKDFLLASLSADKVCDVILAADAYQDKELLEGAKNYFAANRKMILKTDQWKAFKEGNSKIAFEVLESSLN